MKIAIFGAGGGGGYYGARMAQAGHEVRFVARGAHAEAMLHSGLRVRSELGDVKLSPVTVLAKASQVAPVALIVVAVKLWDTEVAARGILPMIGASTVVASLQNGVDMVPDYWIRIDRLISGGCAVALFGTAGGTYVASRQALDSANRWETPAAWLAEVRGNTVAVWRVFADNLPIRRLMTGGST